MDIRPYGLHDCITGTEDTLRFYRDKYKELQDTLDAEMRNYHNNITDEIIKKLKEK